MPMRPPAFVTRAISDTAARHLGEMVRAMRHVTRSNARPQRGAPRRRRRRRKRSRLPLRRRASAPPTAFAGGESEATTRAAWPDSAAAVCPPPVATSRTAGPPRGPGREEEVEVLQVGVVGALPVFLRHAAEPGPGEFLRERRHRVPPTLFSDANPSDYKAGYNERAMRDASPPSVSRLYAVLSPPSRTG